MQTPPERSPQSFPPAVVGSGFARATFLTTILLSIASGCATPIGDQRWETLRTGRYEFYTSASASLTRELAIDLDRFARLIEKITNAGKIQPTLPTKIFVFGDQATYARFRPRRGVAGFMIPSAEANFIAVDASRIEEALTTARHEFVHFVLRNNSAGIYPPWYDEGFAEFLSTATVKEGRIGIGLVPAARGASLTLGTPLDLERILTADEILRWNRRPLDMFYAQSWAFVHLLLFGGARGYPYDANQMIEYLALTRRGRSPEEASVDAFGSTIEELDRALAAYVDGGQVAVGTVALDALPGEEAEIPEGEPVKPTTLLFELSRLSAALGPDHVATTEQMLREVVARDPGHAPALAHLARLALSLRRDDAPSLVDRAVAAGSKDPLLSHLLGDLALEQSQRATEDARREALVRARSLYEQTLALDPKNVAAHIGLGRALAQEDGADLERAIGSFERALELAPASLGVRENLTELYLRAGRKDEARTLLKRVVREAHASVEVRTEKELNRLLVEAGLPPIEDDPTYHLTPQMSVARPEEGERTRSLVPLFEVAGRAGLGDVLDQDIVIAIDRSGSTVVASGVDLDGDGEVGRSANRGSGRSSDPGDSVFEAQRIAATRLIERVNPERARVAVLLFDNSAEVVQPLGTSDDALEALGRVTAPDQRAMTNFGLPLRLALEQLYENRVKGERRKRVIVFLSDGFPTHPTVDFAREDTRFVADELGKRNVSIYAFSLGVDAESAEQVYRDMASLTGGRFVSLADPAEIVGQLERIRLSGLEAVSIENRTTGEAARAVRLFADGSFDGYVPLAPGTNEIEITANLTGDVVLRSTRRILFEPLSEPSADDEVAAREMLDELRLRTQETKLLVEPRRAAARADEPTEDRSLVIEVEPDADDANRAPAPPDPDP